MMGYQTFGLYIVNDLLPEGYKLDGVTTKKQLFNTLSKLAKEHPKVYVEVIPKIKELGDRIATADGISVGLEDIEPEYAKRDKILDQAEKDMASAKTKDAKIKALIKAQDKMGDLAMKHPGSMAMMARSGGRGNRGQLVKAVASPVIVADQKGKGVPFLIRNSYAEGLTPAEYWIAANEARQNVITGQLATAEPGAQGKIFTNVGSNLVITKRDCGTLNGIALFSKSPEILDRYVAKKSAGYERNTLITSKIQDDLIKQGVIKVLVRSPMTCELREGVCQHCQGLDEKGNLHSIGTNVGIRAGQALSEPLTQMALSAKHGARLVKEDTGPTGMRGLVQFTEAPKSFSNKATITTVAGTVEAVDKAPQGGHYVTVASKKFYIPVSLEPAVKKGDRVSEGDVLSTGVIYPPDVVKYKGIGAGRDYLVKQLHENIFEGKTDRRHLELLMKNHLNHARIDDDPEASGDDFIPGEVVDYNMLRAHVEKNIKKVKVSDKLLGEVLGKEALHYTVGTKITERVLRDLNQVNIREVHISTKKPSFEAVVAPLSRVPMFNRDWMQRLNHRYLKDSILRAAHYGEESSTHSLNPMPAYAYGADFGLKPGAKY